MLQACRCLRSEAVCRDAIRVYRAFVSLATVIGICRPF